VTPENKQLFRSEIKKSIELIMKEGQEGDVKNRHSLGYPK